jgi:hypothetical protein
MPFDADMFCARTNLIRLVDKFETSGVVFKNSQLMHMCVEVRLTAKKR